MIITDLHVNVQEFSFFTAPSQQNNFFPYMYVKSALNNRAENSGKVTNGILRGSSAKMSTILQGFVYFFPCSIIAPFHGRAKTFFAL